MRRNRPAAYGLALLVVAAAAGCSTGPGRTPAGPQVEHLAGRRAALDEPVADFRLRDLTREAPTFVSLSELRGRAVVLFFLSYQ